MDAEITEIRDPRRLLQYLDTFFGTRNNIRGDPKENVNFTLETLTYMTSKNRADQITEMIVERMKREGNKIPFGVFDATAGIGGNTMSFLENPAVQWVVSYELRPERREMLRRNLAMYNLAVDAKGVAQAFVPDGPFTGVPANYPGVVLYFDPPWLPEHIKGHESTKDQYVLHGIKIGDKTLEQWITSCANCSMVVMRVPPGYKLDNIPGYKTDQVLLKNSLVIFVTPDNRPPGQSEQVIQPVQTTLEQKQLEVAKPITPVQPTLKTFYVGTSDPRTPLVPPPVVTFSVTTISGTKLPKGVDASEIDWYNGLKGFLLEFLKMILPTEEYRQKMVTDEAMEVWVPCFTEENYHPDIGMNYEELELVGDHMMESNFIMYIYLNIPQITRGEMSELKRQYISKPFQSQIGKKWGLGNWVRTRLPKTTHVFENLLEAFFGAITIVANKVFKFGAGNGLCYNLIMKIFEDIPLDKESVILVPKTVIKEMFEGLHWGTAIEQFETDGQQTTAIISFTPEAVAMLRGIGLNLQSAVLARETGNSKKVASDNAYNSALINLRKMGITDEWVQQARGNRDLGKPSDNAYAVALNNVLSMNFSKDLSKKIRKNRDLSDPELAPYLDLVQKKVQSQGFVIFYMWQARKVEAGTYIQLVGVKADGSLVPLEISDRPQKERDGKKDILIKYLQ